MRLFLIPILTASFAFLGATAPRAPQTKQLQTQVKKLTEERDDLQARLDATQGLQEEAVAARKGRELAREETATVRRELEQLKASMTDNQNGIDNLLKDLRKAQAEVEASRKQVEELKAKLAETEQRPKVGPGVPVVLSPEVLPAKPMNLARLTPRVRKAHGVVVVNVLVSEGGDALEVRLLQGLPGEGEAIKSANDACVEAAKRLVFDPARAADGKTAVKVWQGVGFSLE